MVMVVVAAAWPLLSPLLLRLLLQLLQPLNLLTKREDFRVPHLEQLRARKGMGTVMTRQAQREGKNENTEAGTQRETTLSARGSLPVVQARTSSASFISSSLSWMSRPQLSCDIARSSALFVLKQLP